MRVAVAGSSGLIGSALVAALGDAGHTVSRMTRPRSESAGVISWDPPAGAIDTGRLRDVDAVINLAGRSIGERRWSAAEKALVAESRAAATLLLSEAIAALDRPPAVLLNASAIGYYGDRGDDVLEESEPAGNGFLAQVCVDWEAATAPASAAGVRVVNLRTGIVLSGRGGALGRLLAPFGPKWISPYRWGLGGWIGDGKSWWSWISLDDEVRAIIHLLGSGLSGPVNLSSPQPATNKAFLKAVGAAIHRPVLLPIPKFVLRALLGSDLAEATLFGSQRVLPERLQADGFEFTDTEIAAAMSAALES